MRKVQEDEEDLKVFGSWYLHGFWLQVVRLTMRNRSELVKYKITCGVG